MGAVERRQKTASARQRLVGLMRKTSGAPTKPSPAMLNRKSDATPVTIPIPAITVSL
jgi:hypothetical protein